MKIKFGPRDYRLYPELARFDSDADRAAALETFEKALWRRRSFWLAFLLLVFVLPDLVGRIIERAMPTAWAVFFKDEIWGWLRGGLLVLSLLLGIRYLWYRPRRRHLRRWLADRGVPICICCGYDLSGQIEPRCPECGTPCNPQLIAGQEPEGGWVTTRFQPWEFRAYPELARFASDEDRAAALEAFEKDLRRRRLLWLVALLLIFIVPGVVGMIIAWPMSPTTAGFFEYEVWPWLRGGVLSLFVLLGIQYLWYRPLRRHLRRWLVDRGVPICLRCGYDLSGQIEPRCPECGEACDPAVVAGGRSPETPSAFAGSANPADPGDPST